MIVHGNGCYMTQIQRMACEEMYLFMC